MNTLFDVIVVGGGHAGCEAALAAARMGARTALISPDRHSLGRLSCNPSVGGIAKSHIVCEIDALGGEQARNADFTGIQFRTLNTRKGAAVQAHRLQCDKQAFPARMEAVVTQEKRLEIIEGLATELCMEAGRIAGVRIKDKNAIKGKAVIITAGTFLNGVIFVGRRQIPGGRWSDPPAREMSESIKQLGFKMGRLKTGTPPRLHKDSLDYGKMEIQPGEKEPPFLSRKAKKEREKLLRFPDLFHVEHSALLPWIPGSDQLPCYLTHTNERTHEIIHNNLKRSALYGGDITGTGVRYCPSIEDKIVKFSERDRHHVFIEPEGRCSDRIYPNGTSNSLPEDVQLEMIHSIGGLERAVFIRPGYGIEYDFIDPTQLFPSLESRLVEHLFFAGQVNGTTGYEEAAGQGFVAGVNAVLKLRGEPPLVLARSESYIGVLIDDLVTKGTDEPYRMFTSRAEHRLHLRQSNACFRMMGHARRLGLLEYETLSEIQDEAKTIEEEVGRIRREHLEARLLTENLKYADLPGARAVSDDVALEIETRIKYDGYIMREDERIARAEKMEHQKIPSDINYDAIVALRFEAREKLKKIRPATLGQAARISGVNPPDISILSIWIKKIR